jgi:hypothetical protein
LVEEAAIAFSQFELLASTGSVVIGVFQTALDGNEGHVVPGRFVPRGAGSAAPLGMPGLGATTAKPANTARVTSPLAILRSDDEEITGV